MNKADQLIDNAGVRERIKKSRLPARLDFLQSATGLFLALFMWGHMLFVSSILLGKDAMYTITKFFEGYYFFGEAYPGIVSVVVAFVFVIFIAHAGLAMRKFPIDYKQYKTFRTHMGAMAHDDTNRWCMQVYTGFAMFFLGSVHLYIMLTRPDQIGPYASADRVVSDWMWPLYILLLLSVEFHGGIGLYRLAVKWGWFEGDDPVESRKKLKKYKWGLTGFWLALGFLTLAAYIKIGIEHRDQYGDRYVPYSIAAEAGTEAQN